MMHWSKPNQHQSLYIYYSRCSNQHTYPQPWPEQLEIVAQMWDECIWRFIAPWERDAFWTILDWNIRKIWCGTFKTTTTSWKSWFTGTCKWSHITGQWLTNYLTLICILKFDIADKQENEYDLMHTFFFLFKWINQI